MKKAADREWHKYYTYQVEMGRRKLLPRYDTDSPELNTYSVLIEVEGCFDVKARSEEEIREIIE